MFHFQLGLKPQRGKASCTALSYFVFLNMEENGGVPGVLWCSCSGLLAVQGRKPFRPELQSPLESFEQEKKGRPKSQRGQRAGDKINWCKKMQP